MSRVHFPDRPLTIRRFAVTTHRAVRTGLGENGYVLPYGKNTRNPKANLDSKQPFLSHR
jgi:hypothetical protein